MPLITPTGKANNALPVIRQKVPTMAGRIPPDVMPSVGAPVKNSQSMTPIPLYMIKPRMAKRMPTTLRLSKRNSPNAMFCERCFLLIISFYFLLPEDTASTVKFINKLIKNNTTPKRNNAS